MAVFKCGKCCKEFGSKEALNMHTESKHPEEYNKPLLSNKQKKRIRNYGIMLVILLVVAGFFYWRLTPPRDSPILEIEPSSYNFGTVSQAEGTVSGTMTITNQGNEPLVLKNMDSSCGCTSASVIYKGVEGPRFSMAAHGTNPKDWRQVILPGESADLKVYYNPNVHRDLRGPVKRAIFIYSNDPRHKVKEVMISVNQVD